MPSCACIAESLHMTIHTEVLIENLKVLSRDLRLYSCKIFSTQDHTMAVITHDESDDVFSWRSESIEEYCKCILNALI